MGIVSSDMPFGEVLSIYLYSIAYSIANSVGYFIHNALGDVLTKLPKGQLVLDKNHRLRVLYKI